MRWDEHDALEPTAGERAHQVGDDRVERLVRDRQRAGEVQVVRRAADADGRRDEGVELLTHGAGQLVAEQRIGGERHVEPVLLGRSECDDDRVAAALELGLHLGPGELVELDRRHEGTLTAFVSLPGGEGSGRRR
jgi:hypothetical protein